MSDLTVLEVAALVVLAWLLAAVSIAAFVCRFGRVRPAHYIDLPDESAHHEPDHPAVLHLVNAPDAIVIDITHRLPHHQHPGPAA